MAPKRAPRKRPAAAEVGRRSASRPRERSYVHSRVHTTTLRARAAFRSSRHCEKVVLSRLGQPEADRQALYRRAEAAAKKAAAGYETQGDIVIEKYLNTLLGVQLFLWTRVRVLSRF